MSKSVVDCKKWMSRLPDDLSLSQITIPGTHDSCAFACSLFAKCQNLSLISQLESGVRFIDVRCRHINDRFELYHSSFPLNGYFDKDVVEQCVGFLRSNPSETILMLVSPEHKSENNRVEFDDLFLDYIQSSSGFWHLKDDQMPTLGQTRGKIVLLRRFWSGKRIPLGIDMSGWKHNDTFRIQNCSDIEFFIQDEYKLMAANKWTKVKEVIGRAIEQESGNTWFFNYCSAQNWPVQPPRYIAWSINKALKDHLYDINMKEKKFKGVIVVDFANESLIRDILMLNF